MDGEKNIMAEEKSPSDFAAIVTSPHSKEAFWQALPAQKAPHEVGSWPSLRGLRGFSLFAITALLKNLPYFFKKSLHRLDFRHLFCYNS